MSELLIIILVGLVAGAVGGVVALLLGWWLLSRQLDKFDREIEEERRS